ADPRHHDAVGADVEDALDDRGVVPLDANHGNGVAALDRLQLREQRLKVAVAVLHVDEQPVESGPARDLGGDRAAESEPGPGSRTAFAERALHVVRLHPTHRTLHASAAETLAELDFSRCAMGYIPDILGS